MARPPGPVIAPIYFNAYSQWADKIRLTWNNQENYDSIVVYRDSGSGFVYLTILAGSAESYDDEDITTNTSYTYKVHAIIGEEDQGVSDTDICTCWSDILTDTLSITDSLIDGAWFLDTVHLSDTLSEVSACVEEFTETLSINDYLLDGQTLKTIYTYYLIDSSGNVYEHAESYQGDAGTPISSTFETLNTDFADQDPEVKDENKEIFGARLHYKDLSATAMVSVSYSTDGGASWNPDTKIVGTGDGTTKSQEFFFRATAHTFKFKIDHASANKDFQWSALEIFYLSAGEYA